MKYIGISNDGGWYAHVEHINNRHRYRLDRDDDELVLYRTERLREEQRVEIEAARSLKR